MGFRFIYGKCVLPASGNIRGRPQRLLREELLDTIVYPWCVAAQRARRRTTHAVHDFADNTAISCGCDTCSCSTLWSPAGACRKEPRGAAGITKWCTEPTTEWRKINGFDRFLGLVVMVTYTMLTGLTKLETSHTLLLSASYCTRYSSITRLYWK